MSAAQALVRFLAAQRTMVGGAELALFAGCWAIFGHGDVAVPEISSRPEMASAHAKYRNERAAQATA